MCLCLPSSAAVVSEALLSDSDWETVEPQSFSFSRKRPVVCAENQEDRRHEGTPVKATPASRRKVVPPTPRQSSHSSIETAQWQAEVEDRESGCREKESEGQRRWNPRVRTVNAKNGAAPVQE